MADSTQRSQREGIDLTTLAITAAASGVAAYICSKLWPPGTLASAAAMPVLVAVIREGLRRPTEAVTRVVPVRGVVRSAEPPGAQGSEPEPPPEPATRASQLEPPPRGPDRRWRVAVITGLLGFLVAALVLTVPELVAGGSATGGDRSTTLFGGDKDRKRDGEPSPTTRGRTVTRPGRTVTVPPPTKTTTTPPRTQTAPPTTTTAPAPPAP